MPTRAVNEVDVTTYKFAEQLYLFITVFSAIFSISEEQSLNQEEKLMWRTLSESAVSDIGAAHNLWHELGQRAPSTHLNLLKPYVALLKTKGRLEIFTVKLTLWTRLSQRLGIGYLAEKYLERMLLALKDSEPDWDYSLLFQGTKIRQTILANMLLAHGLKVPESLTFERKGGEFGGK